MCRTFNKILPQPVVGPTKKGHLKKLFKDSNLKTVDEKNLSDIELEETFQELFEGIDVDNFEDPDEFFGLNLNTLT